MKTEDTDRLIQNHEQACITITLPIDRVNMKKNYEVLKRLLRKAKALLTEKEFPDEIKSKLTLRLDAVTAHLPEELSVGLGIYISPNQSTIMPLPFDTKQKVVVDNNFEIRDLMYLKQYSAPYYVLNLSKKGVHLFKGILDEISEIKDGGFPLAYEDQYEYERASISDSSSNNLKSFERDKNQISEIRLKSVFREADGHLKHYLLNAANLLVAGTQKMIALFNNVTANKASIVGKISGSYNENNLDKLRRSAWEAIVRITKKEIMEQITEVNEKRNGHVAEGLQQAMTAASEGKGLVLLIEKDLHHRAYRKKTDTGLHLQPPKKPYEIVPDAVDDLIDTVRAKHGKVLFTEDDQLKAFDHVALVLRY